jgi:transcriptional regulator with XRE-family HTH domain
MHMLNIGEKLISLRKAKGWSQEDLSKRINSSRVMIGKYERSDNAPSIEVLLKLSKVFEVSLDYLAGEGLNAAFDKEMINRLENIENLPQEEKERIFHFMDLIIRDHKAKQAYRA